MARRGWRDASGGPGEPQTGSTVMPAGPPDPHTLAGLRRDLSASSRLSPGRRRRLPTVERWHGHCGAPTAMPRRTHSRQRIRARPTSSERRCIQSGSHLHLTQPVGQRIPERPVHPLAPPSANSEPTPDRPRERRREQSAALRVPLAREHGRLRPGVRRFEDSEHDRLTMTSRLLGPAPAHQKPPSVAPHVVQPPPPRTILQQRAARGIYEGDLTTTDGFATRAPAHPGLRGPRFLTSSCSLTCASLRLFELRSSPAVSCVRRGRTTKGT